MCSLYVLIIVGFSLVTSHYGIEIRILALIAAVPENCQSFTFHCFSTDTRCFSTDTRCNKLYLTSVIVNITIFYIIVVDGEVKQEIEQSI